MSSNDVSVERFLIQRGQVLMQQGRNADAESYFRQAVAQNPNSGHTFSLLAQSIWKQKGKEAEALQIIDKGIELEPEVSDFFSLRALILAHLERKKESLQAAEEAIRLDPTSSFAYSAKAQAHLCMQQWALAEASAREALSHDPDFTSAGNQLSQALRLQNKKLENADQIAGLLNKDPEDEWTHTNAGWAALQQNQLVTAQTHFKEALRLNPGFESAREGLLESFKARSPFYRAYLSYCFFMQRLTSRAQWAVIIGFIVVMQFSSYFLSGPNRIYFRLLILLYFLFVLWVHVAPGVGNLMLLKDRFARHALRTMEKIEACFVGGCVFVGLFSLVFSVIFHAPSLGLLANGVIFAAFPFAHTFNNGSKIGSYFFGGLGGICLLLAVVQLFNPWIPSNLATNILVAAGILPFWIMIATTWLSGVPSLKSRG